MKKKPKIRAKPRHSRAKQRHLTALAPRIAVQHPKEKKNGIPEGIPFSFSFFFPL